jgi:hypothetical protein
MKILFENCHSIDKKLYEKCILGYIYQHYKFVGTNFDIYLKQDKWSIHIINLDNFDDSWYSKEQLVDLATGIPHGVTGMNVVKCYVVDNNNDMFTLQNFSAICHELAHMVLKNYYGSKRGILRHSDFYNSKGDEKNLFSQEVHDRVKERNLRTITVWRNRFRKFRFIGVNILDLCNV